MDTFEIWKFTDLLHKDKVWPFRVVTGKTKRPKYRGVLLGAVKAPSVRKALVRWYRDQPKH